MSLTYLTLDDLYLGLKDLLDKRSPTLALLDLGPRYERLLRPRYEQLSALQATAGSRPLAQELSDTDALHDGVGAAIYHMTEAYRLNPLVDDDLRASATSLQTTFAPGTAELQRTYQDQAANASRRKDKLDDAADDLARFPLAGRGHLGQWVEAFLNAGIQLDVLLSQRASIDASRRQAAGDLMGLRPRTIGLLNQLRSELANEAELNPELPANLDDLLFSYFDQLSEARLRNGKTAPTLPAPAPEPAPAGAEPATEPPAGGDLN